MLIRFSITNYKSFKEKTSLCFVKTLERNHPDHIIKEEIAGFKRLKTSLLYGANASGKSNFIEAFDFVREFILEGRKEGEPTRVSQYKLDKENKISSFDIEIVIDKTAYSYGFDINETAVVDEWLYKIHRKSNDELIYSRQHKAINLGKIDSTIKEELTTILKYTRNNELLLSKAIDMDDKFLKPVFDWFKKIYIISPHTRFIPRSFKADGVELQDYISKLLRYSDTGIVRVEFETVSKESDVYKTAESFNDKYSSADDKAYSIPPFLTKGEYVFVEKKKGKLIVKKIVTIHVNRQGEEKSFPLSDESDGTRRLLDIATPFFLASKNNILLVFDELDRSLHPATTTFLYKSFIQQTENNNSQLIVATHETSLLNTQYIRRDEIYMVNKTYGESSLKPLAIYKERYDKELRKAYLDGRFTGVPNFEDFDA